MKYFAILLALLTPSAAFAQSKVTLDSHAFVEKVSTDAQGRPSTALQEPKIVTPGDRLLFVLSYRNNGSAPATQFVINDPIPQSVVFASAEDNATVSVDGGKTFGALASLQVRQSDGTMRAATPADVTNVRWMIASIAPGAGGKLSFRGVVK